MNKLLLISYNEVSALLLAIGACIAIIGIIDIYHHWMMGKAGLEEKIWKWGCGIIFLILIQVVIKIVIQ